MHDNPDIRERHGGNIYGVREGVTDFSANISPLGMPDEVRRAAEDAVMRSDIYPDVAATALRKAASKATGVDENAFAFGCGACDLIYRITLALRPERVLIEGPAFSEYEAAARLSGAEITFHLEPESCGFRTRTDALIGAITERKPDVVFVSTPSNPAGTVTKTEDMLRILAVCEGTGAKLVADVCFSHFVLGKASELYSCISSRRGELHKGLIIIDSFTKIFATAGMRFGFAAFGDTEDARLATNILQPWPVSTVAAAAGIKCFGLGAKAVEAANYTAVQRKRMTEELNAMGLKAFDGEANYILIKGSKNLAQQLLTKGFLVRNCANYAGLGKEFIRVAVKTADENGRLLAAFREIMQWQKR